MTGTKISFTMSAPSCSQCKIRMLLVGIFPDTPNHEQRTYECVWCEQKVTVDHFKGKAASLLHAMRQPYQPRLHPTRPFHRSTSATVPNVGEAAGLASASTLDDRRTRPKLRGKGTTRGWKTGSSVQAYGGGRESSAVSYQCIVDVCANLSSASTGESRYW